MSNFLEKEIKPILNDIAQLVKETEVGELHTLMLPLIEAQQKNDLVFQGEISLVIYGIPNEIETQQIQQYLAPVVTLDTIDWATMNTLFPLSEKTATLPIRLQHWSKVDFYQIDKQNRLYVVVLICQNAPLVKGLFNHLEMLLTIVPFMTVYDQPDLLKNSKQKSILEERVGFLQIKKWTTLEIEGLKKAGAKLTKPKTRTVLNNYFVLQKVLELIDILNQKKGQIQFNIENKKQRIEQEIVKNQRLSKTTTSSLLQNLKSKVNYRLSKFEKRFTQDSEQQFLSSTGFIVQKVEQKIETLADLDSKKESKNILFHIPETFNQELFDLFKKEVLAYCLKEKREGMTYVRAVEMEIRTFLEEQNLSLLTKGHDFLDDKDIQNLLHRKTKIDRKFEAKVASKSFMEYFMGARMYIMILMMSMSMLGFSSMLMQNRTMMIPPAILLIGLGIFQMWSSKQKEDAENEKKNLADAKTFLTNNMTKIIQDFCRTWEKLFLLGSKENTVKLLQEAASTLQSTDEHTKKRQEIEKKRLQLILSSLKEQKTKIDKINRDKITRDLNRKEENLMKSLKMTLGETIRPNERKIRESR